MVLGGKTALFDNMMTITKIGRLALTRLLKSEGFNATSIQFPAEELDLNQVDTSACICGGREEVQSSGVNFHIWSIELGFAALEPGIEQRLIDGIEKSLVKHSWVFPTHIIKHVWAEDRSHFIVHRISERQAREMLSLQDKHQARTQKLVEMLARGPYTRW